jgi:hypothetical protein
MAGLNRMNENNNPGEAGIGKSNQKYYKIDFWT